MRKYVTYSNCTLKHLQFNNLLVVISIINSLLHQNLIGHQLCFAFGREAILHKAFYSRHFFWYKISHYSYIHSPMLILSLYIILLYIVTNHSKQELTFNRRSEGKNNLPLPLIDFLGRIAASQNSRSKSRQFL